MELPHLGRNCALKQCNRLDFLPVKCDACSEIYCIEHYQYQTHNCDKARQKDKQVPVCPLCSEPVPSQGNQLPDLAVSRHIDQYCRRNEHLKNRDAQKPKTNLQACCFKTCKQKDLIYLECNDCRLKFCIKHRHPSDHSCTGPKIISNAHWQSFKDSCSSSASSSIELIRSKAQQISKSGQAAINRIGANSSRAKPSTSRASTAVNSLQGGLGEQEALALALKESAKLSNGGAHKHEESEDQALARAIHESQLEASRRNISGNKSENCILS